MNNKVERNTKIFAIVIVIAVLLLGIYKLFFEKKYVEIEKIDTETISVLDDNSRFYTVSSCVSKYLNYLSTLETEELLILLSNDYKTKNSINSENIYNYIGTNEGIVNFSPKKMFQQRLSKSVYKYYIKGYIEREGLNTLSIRQDYYIIVILNEKDMTFEIEPYDGSMFK